MTVSESSYAADGGELGAQLRVSCRRVALVGGERPEVRTAGDGGIVSELCPTLIVQAIEGWWCVANDLTWNMALMDIFEVTQ